MYQTVGQCLLAENQCVKHLGFLPLADSWPMILHLQDSQRNPWMDLYRHLTIVLHSRDIKGGMVMAAVTNVCCFFLKTHHAK